MLVYQLMVLFIMSCLMCYVVGLWVGARIQKSRDALKLRTSRAAQKLAMRLLNEDIDKTINDS